ncbi:DUF6234 family protein [Streptomyces sp. NBC_00876]|uniref:DUF6234 family protein n=1 Tax=Streptomyces sp. NBC_00876 TaxID=2975853 RepID=UPI003863A55E|nr:DUF6234 family protein [Streptomyces sp. NBC_00876]
MLLMVEVAVFLWVEFGYGMEVWAAQNDQARIQEAELEQLTWMGHFLIVVIVVAGLAIVCRAPGTLLSQLLATGAVAVLLVLAQHSHDRSHPGPRLPRAQAARPATAAAERATEPLLPSVDALSRLAA